MGEHADALDAVDLLRKPTSTTLQLSLQNCRNPPIETRRGEAAKISSLHSRGPMLIRDLQFLLPGDSPPPNTSSIPSYSRPRFIMGSFRI